VLNFLALVAFSDYPSNFRFGHLDSKFVEANRWSLLTGDCSTSVSGAKGYVTFPNYPNNYTSNQNLCWQIDNPDGNVAFVKITFYLHECWWFFQFSNCLPDLINKMTKYYAWETVACLTNVAFIKKHLIVSSDFLNIIITWLSKRKTKFENCFSVRVVSNCSCLYFC